MFMFEKSKSKAQLLASQNKASRAQEELDRAREKKAAKVTRLRALRLAKEAADK